MQRPVLPPAEDRQPPSPQSQAHLQDQNQLDQSQTSWVLFSPASADDQSESDFSEPAPPSLKTPGRSRLGETGSFHDATRSEIRGDATLSAMTSSVLGDDIGDEDAELDSLDSHLPSFRSLPRRLSHTQQGDQPQDSQAVFPSHDGLGSFNLQQPTSAMEDQIYQFERFNPRRTRHRRESLDRIQAEWESEQAREAQKRQRIEAWRLEHSRVLLEEIQRETRRRRRSSMASVGHANPHHAVFAQSTPKPAADQDMEDLAWHDEDADVSSEQSPSLLARVAQTVIKDILGIDDRMLSILVGEAMPEGLDQDEDLSSTPRASQMATDKLPSGSIESWQTQVLDRVSRELGLLVNQLSHHPGAFSTYTKVQQMPLPYAGLPVIPESSSVPATVHGGTDDEQSVRRLSERTTPSMPKFEPTYKPAARPQAIPERPSTASSARGDDGNSFTKDEWERDLDIKLVFRYIRSRFTSRGSGGSGTAANNGSSSQATHTGSLAASTSQDTVAKAARIRQHHPLISSRPRTADHHHHSHRRSFKTSASGPGSASSPGPVPAAPLPLTGTSMRHGHQSSCASQSTRRSARRSSGSSRHYWDIGGSLGGTGSVIASNGPMGSWGEV